MYFKVDKTHLLIFYVFLHAIIVQEKKKKKSQYANEAMKAKWRLRCQCVSPTMWSLPPCDGPSYIPVRIKTVHRDPGRDVLSLISSPFKVKFKYINGE